MKMTLYEAIVHAKELSESQSLCEDCREEHKQLAEWLEELKQYKNKECEISARVIVVKKDIAIQSGNSKRNGLNKLRLMYRNKSNQNLSGRRMS